MALLTAAAAIHAGETPDAGSARGVAVPDTRFGLFNLLDHRSAYGQGAFPEPFLVDDSDLERNEIRFDWLHTKTGGQHGDFWRTEFEKGFGELTVEVELNYERTSDAGVKTEGFDNVNLGARYPLYQYVSKSGFVDSTLGVGFEAGVPTNSELSKNTELVPKIFNDLRLGNHFTVQTVLGYSALLGSGDQGGLDSFEYGFVFGYRIDHKELPLPHVRQVVPVLELSGETELNKDNPGHNSLRGDAAVRFNMDAIGPVQPRLGVGFVFPIDSGARQDTHWGIYTSLVFEY